MLIVYNLVWVGLFNTPLCRIYTNTVAVDRLRWESLGPHGELAQLAQEATP